MLSLWDPTKVVDVKSDETEAAEADDTARGGPLPSLGRRERCVGTYAVELDELKDPLGDE